MNNIYMLDKQTLGNKIVLNKEIISKITNLIPPYKETFLDMHEKEFMKIEVIFKKNEDKGLKSLQSYKTKRSKILDFLNYLSDKKINNNLLSKDILEDYFLEYLGEEAPDTFESRTSFINSFMHEYPGIFSPKLDVADLRTLTKEIEYEKKPAQPLELLQIDNIRQYYSNNKYNLFIFDMFYKYKATFQDLKKCTYKSYNEEINILRIGTKIIKIDNETRDKIIKLKENKHFNSGKSVYYILKEMEEELQNEGIIKTSFRRKDIIETRKKVTFLKCPECGDEFEATSDNWVIKQHYPEGKMWIVCKQNCSKEM